MIEDDKNNARRQKLANIATNRANIAMINAERQAVKQDEDDYWKKQEAFGNFPYTHGDSIEMKRKEIREQMKTHYNAHIQRHSSQPSIENESTIERETRLFPQGGHAKVSLRDQFQKATPFYFKVNKPVIVRKMDHDAGKYVSNMEAARKRFEDEIVATNNANKKTTEEYFNYMDESTKFAQLQKIKKRQENMVNRNILEQQMEMDRKRKIASRENRKTSGNMTFGPIQTDQTAEFDKKKQKYDV